MMIVLTFSPDSHTSFPHTLDSSRTSCMCNFSLHHLQLSFPPTQFLGFSLTSHLSTSFPYVLNSSLCHTMHLAFPSHPSVLFPSPYNSKSSVLILFFPHIVLSFMHLIPHYLLAVATLYHSLTPTLSFTTD